MKTCVICKLRKGRNEFNRHSKRADGLQIHCKKCGRERSRAYYHRNRKTHAQVTRLRTSKRIKEHKARIISLFVKSGCTDCGTKDVLVLEFDHARGVKLGNVNRLLNRGCSWKVILKEIRKCDIVCANCHKRRTYARSADSYRWLWVSSLAGKAAGF